MSQETTLILGGARSGKSQFAENLVLESGLKPVYIATGRAFDEAMTERIEKHKDRRGDVYVLLHEAMPGRIVLVDCLTLWVTNLMMAEANVQKETDGLISCLSDVKTSVVFVSNEVGQGVVPENAMAREFIDLSGLVHQRLAGAANHVYFVTAGLPQKLK